MYKRGEDTQKEEELNLLRLLLNTFNNSLIQSSSENGIHHLRCQTDK